MTGDGRTALVVTTPAAAGKETNGASLRADEVVRLLEDTGHEVTRSTTAALGSVPRRTDLAVAVAVSYASAGAVTELRRRAPRVWLDAVDSWLTVNGSGLRSGRPSYALRAVRDAGRLLRMPRPDLVTWISGADLLEDRGTVRGHRQLVLPGRTPVVQAAAATAAAAARRVVLAGDWGYSPNRDGLTWFCEAVLPELERLLPTPSWHVDVHGTGVPELRSPRLRAVGYTSSSQDLYRAGDVHAAPVRFGGGVKRKVLAPLLAGLPVVTTSAGAHGLRQHSMLDVHDRATAFAAGIARLLQSPPVVRPVPPEALLDRDDSGAVVEWLRT